MTNFFRDHKQEPASDDSYKKKIQELAADYNSLSLQDQTGEALDLMYDDEYDDTYDANEVGADDADEALDLMGRSVDSRVDPKSYYITVDIGILPNYI